MKNVLPTGAEVEEGATFLFCLPVLLLCAALALIALPVIGPFYLVLGFIGKGIKALERKPKC